MSRLEVDRLRKSYPPRFRWFRRVAEPPRAALDGVSLEVGPGEVVGLVGENGAGKTTLLKCVLGLLRPDDGTIRLGGETVDVGSPRHRRRLGYVSPVERSFYLRLTCLENLVFFARLQGIEGDTTGRSRQALASVGLGGRADERVDALSSGMRQRLALARALLHEPDLLLLDEPTRSLDPVARGQIHDLVRDRRGGRGVLIASHDLDEVAGLCDRVVILQAGRAVASGTLDEIRRQLDLREAWSIVLDAPLPASAPLPPGATASGLTLRLDMPPGGDTLDAALGAIRTAGRKIVRVDRVDRPLEEAMRAGKGEA